MDPNILDLDFDTLSQLEMILGNRSTRESFLKAVPSRYFNYNSIQQMDNEAYKYHMTTARWLLFQLGNRGVRVSDMINWLEKQDIQKALVLLKKDVPLQIIEQPPAFIKVQKGSQLVVHCKASSFPPAEYQWFKEDKELLAQQESELSISSMCEEDVGTYICLVSKLNLETKDYSWMYSTPVEVVLEGAEEPFENTHISENHYLSSVSNETQTSTKEICTLNSSQFLQQIIPKTYNIPVDITIIKHPYVKKKIPQGMSVLLHCKAESHYPLKYQWYENGKVLNGATSRKLVLNDLHPDLVTGNMMWEYQCEVSNDYNHVLSKVATVELENPDNSTPYVASGKYAFMIANEKYANLQELRKPANDVADLAKCLESMKFKVFAYINLTGVEMKNAFKRFCAELKPNCYVLFYFAGHGFEQYGQMYLQAVDSSDDYRPQESICTEYILKCMQESNPALNILLIDACRKLPPQFSEEPNALTPPGEIFKAKMKNNTLYGYSTPFLYSSHESNAEHNSFFVKHLKKYICYNKSIQEVLFQVQRDFEGDPTINGVQFPVIKSSLSAYRKLCDELEPDHNVDKNGCLKDIKADYIPMQFDLTFVCSSIILEIRPIMDVFINGVDVTISIDISKNSLVRILEDLEVNLIFNVPEIEVLPIAGVHLKNLDLEVGNNDVPIKNEILKKRILGLQKVKDQKLTGKLHLNFSQLGVKSDSEISINIEKISNMKLSFNFPDLDQTEDTEAFSCENNSFFPSHN